MRNTKVKKSEVFYKTREKKPHNWCWEKLSNNKTKTLKKSYQKKITQKKITSEKNWDANWDRKKAKVKCRKIRTFKKKKNQ